MRRIRCVFSLVFISFALGAFAQVAKRPVVVQFGKGEQHLLVKQVPGSTNEIAFDIDLGTAYTRQLKSKAGLPNFSTIDWSALTGSSLPAGASIITVAEEGRPEIPYLVLTVAIPSGAKNFTPFITPGASTTLTAAYLPLRPYQVNDTTVELRYDKGNYESARQAALQLSAPARFRSLRMIAIRIPLVVFNAKTGVAVAQTKFRAGIRFTMPVGKGEVSKARPDPYMSGLYSSAVVNTADIAKYSVALRKGNDGRQTPQGFSGERTFDPAITEWIDRQAPYIKMTVTRTGLYRVTAAELSASGIDASQWNAGDVRLFNKGSEVPVRVEEAGGKVGAIEFNGERLPGFPGEYYNWSSDSNGYWLTNATSFAGTPKRYAERAIGAEPSEVLTDGISNYHHEHDNFYFGGDNTTDESKTLHRTDWISGERFVWRILREPYLDNSNLITFDISDTFMVAKLPDQLAGKSATFSVYVRGISQDNFKTTGHKAELRLNGKKISEVAFVNFEDTLHQFSVPLDQIREGQNVFEIVFGVVEANAIDQWYLDYYEVGLPQGLSASQDTAIAFGQWQFHVKGASDHSILRLNAGSEPRLFNLTDGVTIRPIAPSGNSYAFRDSIGEEKEYVAATLSSFLKPARIQSWNTSGKNRWNDILDTSGGADYMVITHPEFLAPAQKLAARRASAGLRAKVVTTDEIYNAFNFGADEPMAIKQFLHYAFDFYEGTPPAFVTIMGDATWDPKFNLNNPLESPANRTIHRNFVHTYGVPSSDAIFTFLEGHAPEDSLNQDIVIARLPVESVEEAEHYLDKLAEYEARPPEEWNRDMLFTIGGTTKYENDNFWAYLGQFFELDDWGGIRNPPLGINTTVISRTDFADGIDKTHVGELQSEFREGKSLVYFFGHGATFITDVFFSDPGLYRNKSLYPVFITLSCRTGAYAEPNQITLNEAFLRQPAGGVIMAYGTTGFGEVLYDRRLTANIFSILRNDTSIVRQPKEGPHMSNIASVFTLAKFVSSVIENVGGTLSDSWYNSLHQYSVLGDAAMGFALRPQPEFNVSAGDVTLTDTRGNAKSVFSVTDSFVTVTAKVHNFGRVAQNEVHVLITNVQPKREVAFIDTLVRLDSSATISVLFPLDTFAIGTNQLRIKIDNDELYAETEEGDNEVTLTFQVSGFSAAPFFPPEGAKNFCDISGDSVRFILLVPNATALTGNVTGELEVDTSSSFTSPVNIWSFPAGGSGFFERMVRRSLLPTSASGVIWWRSRLVIAGKPTAWTESSAMIGSNGVPMFSYTTGDQLERTIVSGLRRDPDGGLSIPSNDTIVWNVISSAHNDTNANHNAISQIIANHRPLKLFTANGILVAPLTLDNANLADTLYEFLNTMNDDPAHNLAAGTELTRQFDSIIALIPEGRKVIVVANFQPFIEHFTREQTVTDALKSLGSRNGFDSLYYFGTYAMIGQKGAPSGSAAERFGMPNGGGAEVFDTVVVTGSSGSARIPSVFVANSYGKLFWKATELAKDSSLVLRVLGEPRLGGQAVVLKNIFGNSGTSADLSDIDARQYPRIAIDVRFARPNDVTQSPHLYSIEYEYDPAPEFIIEPNSLYVNPFEVEEGYPVASHYTVRNILCIDGRNVPVSLVRTYQGTRDTLSRELIGEFTGHTERSFDDSISTFGQEGKVGLTAVVNPGGAINEQLLFNNAASFAFDVRRDSSKPRIDVLFDKQHIQNGDYVSSRVEITVQLFDDSPVRVKDSTSLIGILRSFDGTIDLVTFDATKPSADYNVHLTLLPTGEEQAELIVSPKTPLPAGRYNFTAFGFDGSGNASDTLEFDFVVSDKQGIEHVMNYPNPFTDLTAFTFVLRSAVPSDVNVYVYTTAGRRIRTLTLPSDKQRPGINSIEWDGRDEDGNDVANGTYLYKVVVAGKNEDGSDASDAVFEKAVRSR